ncbi:MAG: ATP-dependent RecD-like DNA helicase [Ruminococcaceae bacterium]|nr:ATP-dependent RecD-like DNA helicase [Oscillospiraceae bacterium]
MHEMEILQGNIASVVFQNYDNGYSVLRMECENGQTVTVVGTIPLPFVGERLMVTGKWSSHPSYGRQFEAEFLERLLPQTNSQILTYLSGRAIKGIGPKLASAIVNRFGEQTLAIMEREPERLSEISGISDAKALAIGEAYRLQIGVRHILEFFALHLLPPELAIRCYKLYGDRALDLLYDDPYLLMDDGFDAPFAAVDRFAIELGVSGDDPRRVEAGIRFELHYNASMGHSFLPQDKLAVAVAQLLGLDGTLVSNGISRLIAGEQLIPDTLAGIPICYLPDLYEAEIYCKTRLLSASRSPAVAPANLGKLIRSLEKEIGISYAENQVKAITQAINSRLLIISGGPGTGKTTIVNAIVALYKQMGLTCLLGAPTGRAAYRLSEVTGENASTIHRLLESGIDPVTGDLCFNRNANNPLKTDAVIIDEMSMMDILLFHKLLSAIPEKARIILVGDPDQLPPIGPGFPFRDILRSGAVPCVILTEIFRQAQESLIVMNAHRVNKGQMPELRDRKSDFFFLSAKSEEEVAQTILGLCTTRLPQNMGIPPEQIQVLTPTKKGPAGTVNLNIRLQAGLNPSSPNKRERQFGQYTFREGDRVMQVRNNYDILWKSTDGSQVGTGIFNGDIGVISEIDPHMEQLHIVFDGKEAIYEFSQLNELEPAYAITVHKSQGSEYRAVILSAWNSSPYLLKRSVLYTAITRAKELLIIVGREDTVAAMVENAKNASRYTGLKLRLQEKDK